TISQLVMNATDNLYIVCDFKVNNYNYTITGDLPYYKDGSDYNHSVIKITYITDKNAGSRNERELLEEHVTYIKQLKGSGTAHDYYVKTDTGDYAKVSGTQYTISVAYKYNIKIEITESINSVYNECWFGVPRPRTGVSGDSYDIIDTSTPNENDSYETTALPNENATTINAKITSHAAIKFFFDDKLIHLTLGENRDGWLNSDINTIIAKWSHSNAGGNELSTPGYSVVYGTTLKLYANNTRVKFDTYNWKTESRTTDGDSIYWSLANSTNYRATGYETATTYSGVDGTETLTSDRDLDLIVKRIYYIYFEENVPLSDYAGTVAYMPSNLSTTALAVTKEEYFHMYGKSGANYVRPSLTGYTFQGWDSSATGASPANLSIANTVDSYHLNVNYNTITQLTFSARWTANPVTVNYVIKVMDPDGVNDVTSQITDLSWTVSSQTACYDDILHYVWFSSGNGVPRQIITNLNEYTSKNVYIMNSHKNSNGISWNGSQYFTPKYEFVSYTHSGKTSTVGLASITNTPPYLGPNVYRVQDSVITLTVTLKIAKYAITVYNNSTAYVLYAPFNTSVTMPSRVTPSDYLRSEGSTTVHDYAKWHYVNLNSHVTLSYTDITGYTPAKFSNTNLSGSTSIFNGIWDESSGGNQITSFTVVGNSNHYIHWESAWVGTVQFASGTINNNYSTTTVDGYSGSMGATYTYWVPNSTTSVNTVANFSSTHPWYTDSGGYKYLSTIGNYNVTYTFTQYNSNYVGLNDQNKTSYTLALSKSYPSITSKSTIAFKPGVSVALYSNDYRTHNH
ncbi:MAG: hypothetical protein IK070_01035, partial [Clostridia bacterium]|nr:hypothetical protein [Clostridia bacterium]